MKKAIQFNKKRAVFAGKLLVAVSAVLIVAVFLGMFLTKPKRIPLPKEAKSEPEAQGEIKAGNSEEGLIKGAENTQFILYFDSSTGGICIEDKQDGMQYYAVPPGSLTDPMASEPLRKQLSSPIRLTYYNIAKKQEVSMNSYEDALLLNQVSWAELSDGIRIFYTLGREETKHLIPFQISEAAMDELIAAIPSERTVKQVKAFYFYYSLEELEAEKQEELLEKYPALSSTGLYVLKNSVTDRDKKVLEDAFIQAGYTYEQMEEEYEKLGYEAEEETFPCFRIAVDCRLTTEGVDVSLDTEEIDYDKELFYLLNLTVFPCFGAGETGKEGYVFLPDGSGTLLYFNNEGTKRTLLTRGKLYGADGAELSSDQGGLKQEFRFPVFGVKTEEHAVFTIIRNGDAIAQINAEMGNINHSYHLAYADFVIRRKESFLEKGAFEQTPWIMYDKTGYTGRIELEYKFLSGTQADYSGMARSYRRFLENQGMKKLSNDTGTPFILETLGAVTMPVRRLGIPVMESVAITSFEAAADMVTELQEMGIPEIKLRYKGWYNGGYFHTAASNLKVPSSLGGKSGLKQLSSELKQQGVALFPDVDFLIHDQNTTFDDYYEATDGIRTLFQKNGYYPNLVVSTLKMLDWYYCVNPNLILGYYDKFSRKLDKEDIENISLGSAGRILNSNYKNSDYVNRQTSKRVSMELMRQADEDYGEVMVDGGNGYVLPYADYCLNLADSDSSYLVADQSVPFAQIALHGYLQYASAPLNLSSNYETDVLRCIEYGQIPYFLLCEKDSSIFKQAYIFDEVYSVNYELWKERAVECYTKISTALHGVEAVPILRHEQLIPGVFLTTYENGVQIAVNYNEYPVEVGETEVAAMDYATLREKDKGGEK